MSGFLPLLRREWPLLAYAALMTFASSFGQTFFIALFAGDMRAALDLSHGGFGSLYSAATVASAALLLWTGGWIDRIDLRRFSVAAALGLALGCALLALSTGPLSLFLALLCLRHFGQALMSLAGITSVVRYLDRDRGKASALTSGGFALAEAILPALAVLLLAWVGWRQSWLLAALFLALPMPVLIGTLLRGQDERHRAWLARTAQTVETRHDGAPAQQQWTRGEMLRDPDLYLYLPALMAQPLLFTGFMFHQVPLVEEKGWSLGYWASLFTLYALVSTLCKLVAGVAIDRFGAQRLLPPMVLPLGLALLVVATVDDPWGAVAFMILLGVSTGLYTTAAAPFYAERYGTRHLGSIKSVTTAFMVLSTAVAPVLMGAALDRGMALTLMAWAGFAWTLAAAALALLARARSTAAAGA